MRILAVSIGLGAPLFVPAPGNSRQQVMSGIRKSPVSTLDDPRGIALRTLGFEGDEQVDLTVHGGRDKAVYAYPVEHYPVWQTMREQATRIDRPLPYGFMGENLTIEGLLETALWIGDVLNVTSCGSSGVSVRLRVSGPRRPCRKLNARMGFQHAGKMMMQSAFTGFYLEVLEPGTIAAGDRLSVIPGSRDISIREMHQLRAAEPRC